MMMIVVDFVSSFKHFSLQTLPFHFSGKKVEISVSQRSLCLGKTIYFSISIQVGHYYLSMLFKLDFFTALKI